jgi:hypothetical protein
MNTALMNRIFIFEKKLTFDDEDEEETNATTRRHQLHFEK